MKVYVIMGNDFPECVFADKLDADEYVKDREQPKPRRIHWRVYEFDLIRKA